MLITLRYHLKIATPPIQRKMTKKLIGLALFALTLVSLGWAWYSKSDGIVIDNAFVSSRVLHIVARNDGVVSEVNVVRGQSVKKGQILMLAGHTENELQMNIAAEKLKAALNEEDKACKNQKILHLELNRASLRLMHAQSELERSQRLVADNFISSQALDQKRSQMAEAFAEVKIASGQLEKSVTTNRTPVLERPLVRQLINELQSTYYSLHESKIEAPFDGYVYDIRTYAGKYVEKGEALLVLVPKESQLIEANVLESEVAQIRPGLAVSVRSDVRRNSELKGFVESIVPSVAAAFSAIPRNNIDSNWIKTSQRVPVLIRVNDGSMLPVGSSVKVTVLPHAEPYRVARSMSGPDSGSDRDTDWKREFQKYLDRILRDKYVKPHLNARFNCAAAAS